MTITYGELLENLEERNTHQHTMKSLSYFEQETLNMLRTWTSNMSTMEFTSWCGKLVEFK